MLGLKPFAAYPDGRTQDGAYRGKCDVSERDATLRKYVSRILQWLHRARARRHLFMLRQKCLPAKTFRRSFSAVSLIATIRRPFRRARSGVAAPGVLRSISNPASAAIA